MTFALFTQTQIFEFIKKHEPFNQMSDSCLWRVAKALEIESHPGNTLLIKKGERLDDLYVLIKGRLYYKVTDAEGNTTFQGELNEGAIIGEMALLADQERSADVYTLRDSIILKLTKNNFLNISWRYPELLNKMTQFTIKRLTNSLQGLNTSDAHNKSIAIIPVSPIPEIQLQEMINKYPCGEKILLLTSELIQKENDFLNTDGSMNHDGILWINKREEKYSFIFYLADPTVSAWTKFCLRQADSFAFIAQVEQNTSECSEVEHYIQESQQLFPKRSTLLLLHQTSAPPQNTEHWLKKRSVNNHYHIQFYTEEGKMRLMRIFTDHTISMVLSGGGARGLAHMGFMQLLEERGIPVDHIAGTSMGALLAAGFAMGHSSAEVLNFIHTRLEEGARIDFTFPYISIASGRRMTKALMEIIGEDKQIEDLWLNFFCVSTDLVGQKLYVHNRGLLWEAIRSSISLPFIYPPVTLEDKLLLDGGVLNNIPIDVMRQHSHNSIIIASNIADGNTLKHTPLPYHLSGWKLLYNKFMGDPSSLPLNIGELVLRLLTISSHQNTQRMLEMADVAVSLKVEQFGMLDFKWFKEIALSGYQQAKEQFKATNELELIMKKQK